MQTAQPMDTRPVEASAPAKPQGNANSPKVEQSFRSTMEKAESKLQAQADQTDSAQPEAATEAEQIPTQQNAEALLELEAGSELAQHMTWAQRLEAMILQKEAGTKEGSAPALEETEQPGEDVPVKIEAKMAILGALLMQQPVSETPAETVQHAALEGQDPMLVHSTLREGPKSATTPAATLHEQENILPEEAPQLSAMRAQAVEAQPGKFVMQDMHAQIETHVPFSPQREEQSPAQETATMLRYPAAQTDVVVDLSAPDGEALPAKEAQRLLGENLFEQVQSALSTGKQDLLLRLKPESLGELVIHLTMTHEGLKAQVRTNSENVQHLVAQQLYQVEDALRLRDIPVVQMDVIYDQATGSGFFGHNGQSYQGSEHTQGYGHTTFGAPIDDTAMLYEAALTVDAMAQIGSEGVVYSA